MKTVANTQTALQLLFSEMPHVEAVILILGGSPGRPRHVYEVSFSHGQGVRIDPSDFTRTRVARDFKKGHWYPKVLDLDTYAGLFYVSWKLASHKTYEFFELGELKLY
ncbi:hypothetical protein Tco_0745332 [Tanacetum coccineum]